MRIRSLCVMLLAGLVVAGCDSDCPTPTAPSSPNPGLGVASLTISGPEQLEVGQTAQLTATARLSDGTSQDVTTATAWVTNNVNVCTINAAGVLTAVAAGQCTINAVFQNVTGTHVVTCFFPGNPPADPNPPTGPPTGPPSDPNPPPSGPTVGLRIEGPSSVLVGQQIQLRAFRTDNGQEVTDQATWSGNNNGVAAVGSQGRVTGVGNGTMTVQAVFQGAGAVKTITVSGGPTNPQCPGPNCPPPPVCQNPPCNPPPPATQTGLAIQGVTSVNVGQTSQLQAIASFSDGTTRNVTGESQWSSGDAGIASVNGTGLVTGVAGGQTPVSAAFGGQTATVGFTVSSGPPPAPSANSLTVTGTSPLTVGQTSQYNAIANMSDGTTPNVNGQAQWSSSNPGVATVGSTGIVTAVAPGQTTITATFQSRSGSVPLTVNAAQPDLIGLELNINGNILAGNGPLGLNLNLSDLINGNPILGLKVFGLYSDGSKRDVTSLAAINSPLLTIDGQGVVDIVSLLLRGLLQPNHPINVTYGGFTANVVVNLQLPVLNSLGFPSNNISLLNGQKLPSLNALFSQGINSTVDAGLPGIQHALTIGGPLGTLLNSLLPGFVNQVFSITNGVLNINQGLLAPLLANPLVQALLGPGGVIPLTLTSTINGVSTAPITLNVK
jgi:hypothetical protein